MKRIFSLVLIFVFLATAFTACNDSGTATTATDKDAKPAFDLAAAKTAIDARNVEFGGFVSKMDSVGLAGLYTSDGTLMGPNMPAAKGKAAIQSTFAGMFSAMGSVGLTLTAGEVFGTEDLVSEVGTFTMTGKDGKEIDKGKYIVLWKMENGKWKMHRDIWSSDWPCPPPPPVSK